MTRNLPIWTWTVDNQVTSIFMASNVRACAHKHLITKSPQINLLVELCNKNWSAHTTSFVSATMGADKYIGTLQNLLNSRSPWLFIHKDVLNKAIHIRISQTPLTKKQKDPQTQIRDYD